VLMFFADDSTQVNPSRVGMGSLVATGGLLVECDAIASLERSIAYICKQFGFPPGEEFKRSPRTNSWMHGNLIGCHRHDFFLWVIQTCSDHGAKATVIISDETSSTPLSSPSHSEFVTKMLIERVNWLAKYKQTTAIIVADRPGGGTRQERAFLSQCMQNIQNGTGYVMPERIAINALSTDSKFVRLLQTADLIVSCVTAFAAGENTHSPPLFAAIRPLLASDMGRTGGVGLKLHPDLWYVNLYHWLLGDSHFIRSMNGWPLPLPRRPYARNANTR